MRKVLYFPACSLKKTDNARKVTDLEATLLITGHLQSVWIRIECRYNFRVEEFILIDSFGTL